MLKTMWNKCGKSVYIAVINVEKQVESGENVKQFSFLIKNDKIQTVILTLYKNQYVKHSNFTN